MLATLPRWKGLVSLVGGWKLARVGLIDRSKLGSIGFG
jgi:hypothetical protein